MFFFVGGGETWGNDSPDPGWPPSWTHRQRSGQAIHVHAGRQAHRPVRGDRQATWPDLGTLHPGGKRDRQERRRLHIQDCLGVRRLQQRLSQGNH